MAAIAWLVFETSAERSSRRDAIAVSVAAPSLMKRVKTAWSSASSLVRSLELLSQGAKYLVLSRACWALPSYQSPEPRTRLRRPSRAARPGLE
jgi:hypothetical protein